MSVEEDVETLRNSVLAGLDEVESMCDGLDEDEPIPEDIQNQMKNKISEMLEWCNMLKISGILDLGGVIFCLSCVALAVMTVDITYMTELWITIIIIGFIMWGLIGIFSGFPVKFNHERLSSVAPILGTVMWGISLSLCLVVIGIHALNGKIIDDWFTLPNILLMVAALLTASRCLSLYFTSFMDMRRQAALAPRGWWEQP